MRGDAKRVEPKARAVVGKVDVFGLSEMGAGVVPCVTLADGTTMPRLGLGTWLIPPDRAADTVRTAIDVGYRHFDTAQFYGNERGVGQGVASSGVPRDDIYVTSKLSNANHRRDDVLRSFDLTLKRLRLERLDLFLIHWPLPTLYGGDFVGTWRAMAELLADGRLTSIGVSNFQPAHLRRLESETGITPVVNQIEVHPRFPNDLARGASYSAGAVVQAWSPLAQGAVLREPVLVQVAEDVGRTVAQVVLNWHMRRGDVALPKASSVHRMRENISIFDFELSRNQAQRIGLLDRGEAGRIGEHPDRFDSV